MVYLFMEKYIQMVLQNGKKRSGLRENTKEKSVTNVTNSLMNKWIGWKTVIYNINNDSAVKMKSDLT